LKNGIYNTDIFNASLIEVVGSYGHCSSAMKSSCADHKIRGWLLGDRKVGRHDKCQVNPDGGAFQDGLASSDFQLFGYV
jgi:hypothetical protein